MVRLDFAFEESGASFTERGDENGMLGAVAAQRDLDVGRRGDGAFADAARDGPHRRFSSSKMTTTTSTRPSAPDGA